MQSPAFSAAASGKSVLLSETNLERLQLVGRAGHTTFVMGGSRDAGGATSGLNPYEMMSASLAACTAMTIRMYAERKSLELGRVHVNVAHRRVPETRRDVFERTVIVEGAVDDRLRESLTKIANLCPVGRTLGQGSDILTMIEPAPGSAPAESTSDYAQDVRELEIPNVDW